MRTSRTSLGAGIAPTGAAPQPSDLERMVNSVRALLQTRLRRKFLGRDPKQPALQQEMREEIVAALKEYGFDVNDVDAARVLVDVRKNGTVFIEIDRKPAFGEGEG